MSYQLSREWAIGRWTVGLCLLVPVVLSAGCGGGDDPITAQKSQYQVGGDDDTGAGSADVAASPSGTPSEPSDGVPGAAASAGRLPGGGEAPSDDAAPPRVRPGAGGGRTPAQAANPNAGGEPAAAPNLEGTPEELLAQLEQLERREPSGRNNRELLENIRKWLATRLAIADKLLASDATEPQRMLAARTKKVVLLQLAQTGQSDIEKILKQFCLDLIKSPGEEIQQFGHMIQLEMALARFAAGVSPDQQPVVDAITAALAGPNRGGELFQTVASAAIALQQGGQPEAALVAMKAVEDAFKDTMDQRIAAMLGRLGELRVLLESGIDARGDAIVKGEPMAVEKFMETVDQLLANKPGGGALEKLTFMAQQFEFTRRYEVTNRIYAAVEAAYQNHEDQDLVKRAAALVAAGRKRIELIGKPVVVEGKDLDGQPFVWKPYEGKIVLIDFWATWCGPCQQELPNIKRNYDRYHDQGFEVIGINLDQERADLDRFLTVQPLPWANVVDANALAEQWGVESIPFVVLVGRDGRVLDLHVRGTALTERLAELFGAPGEKPAGDSEKPAPEKPSTEKPAGEKPSTEKPAEKPNADKPSSPPAEKPGEKPSEEPAAKPAEKPAEKPTAEKPAADKPGADQPPSDQPATEKPTAQQGTQRRDASAPLSSFVGQAPFVSDSFVADPPARQPATTKGRTGTPARSVSAPAEPAAPANAPSGPQLPDVNPYAPRADLQPQELVEFLDKMLDKPRSIRNRPGFADAVVMAADRLLAHASATPKQRLIAITAKIDTLHHQALEGNEQADEKLAALVDSLASADQPSVVQAVRFLRLERRVVTWESDAEAEIVKLLAEVREFCQQEKLQGRHLRLASNTVRVINKIPDDTTREKYFAEFGALFGKSSDKTLARYGKKLATPPEASESGLVGQPLELAGRTLSSEDFQWARYRGKVVLVDFWATWCGPCLREMPHVRALYDKFSSRGFDVVGISLDQDLEALAEFNNQHKLPWTTLAGEETQALAKRYGVRGIPTMMLVDKSGKVVAVAHRVEELASRLEALLK
ncbi:MAG: redoxin family protein [Pirellulales bacterium]